MFWTSSSWLAVSRQILGYNDEWWDNHQARCLKSTGVGKQFEIDYQALLMVICVLVSRVP